MAMSLDEKIERFLAAEAFAVAGASADREKYGNKVVRVYQQRGRRVFPVNPKADAIEGEKAYPSVAAVPPGPIALSVVTPPAVTRQVVREALARGVRQIWMQPGSDDAQAVIEAEAAGASVIHGGPCVLVALGYREGP